MSREIPVELSPPASLPSLRLDPTAPLGRAFGDRGVDDLVAAALWLRDLPYGETATGKPEALFAEGRGTCKEKHRTFALLAREVHFPVEWVWGYYRLDDEVLPGVEEVVRDLGVPFALSMHCFLRFAHAGRQHYVDLTEGNCDGKARRPPRYLELHPVDPASDARHHFKRTVARLRRELDELALVPEATFGRAIVAAHEHKHSLLVRDCGELVA